jgi:streptogramin lyase
MRKVSGTDADRLTWERGFRVNDSAWLSLRFAAFAMAGVLLTASFAAAVAASRTAAPRLAASHSITISEFNSLPYYQGFGFPEGITSGPGKALWVTDDVDQDFGTPSIAEIGTDGKRLAAFYYGEVASPAGFDIAAGPDGALWFADAEAAEIKRLGSNGKFTSYRLPYTAYRLAFGADGALWFPEFVYQGSPRIGRLTTSGQLTEYATGLPARAGLADIVAGPDGAMWLTVSGIDRIVRIALGTHAVSEFGMGMTPGAEPDSIALGPDGALWFTEQHARQIGRITTSGVVTEFPVPSGAKPRDITAGPDGALWFTEDLRAGIGRITTGGAVTEYGGVSGGSEPSCIVAGPDGNLWFTEYRSNRIGRVNLH